MVDLNVFYSHLKKDVCSFMEVHVAGLIQGKSYFDPSCTPRLIARPEGEGPLTVCRLSMGKCFPNSPEVTAGALFSSLEK